MAWPPARAGSARQIATRGHRMTKPELGTKRVCVACNTRFYDLTKTPAVCPKCGTEQPIEQPRMRRPGGNVSDQKPIKKPVPAVGGDEADLPEVEGVEDEAEEDVLEDAADLEDADDAIGPEIEVEPDTDEAER
jgi:uncharacterized protein (TIGR02300 family)